MVADLSPDKGLQILKAGRRAISHSKYLLLMKAPLGEAEDKARDGLQKISSAMNWLEDFPIEFEIAHQALDEAGRYVRETFGCQVAFRDGQYWQDCAVDFAHTRLGMSIGAIVQQVSCSICGKDPYECSHIAGRAYDGEQCHHIIKEAEITEISLVKRPSFADARLQSISLSYADLRERLGQDFKYGVPLSCDVCIKECRGITWPEFGSHGP